MLSTGILVGSQLESGWSFRERAKLVAHDAAQLQAVAAARAQLDAFSLPIQAVSYAAGMGISTTALDSLLQSAVPFGEQLQQATASITGFPDFSSPKLRADVAELHDVSLRVAANTISYDEVTAFLNAMKHDVDRLWYQTYDQLQADISAWRAPGSFGVHAATLVHTYEAFLSGDRVVEQAYLVLLGVGGTDARQELIRSDGVYQVAISQFAGHLSPRAQDGVGCDAGQAVEPAVRGDDRAGRRGCRHR